MPEISTLGYFCIQASDLSGWETFAADLLGLQVCETDKEDALRLRMDEYEQRIVIEQGDEDDLVAVGWKFDSAGALEQYVDSLRLRGIPTQPASQQLTDARRVERIYSCTDPDGMQHELFYGPACAPASHSFRSKVLKGGFVTGNLGVGHFVSAAKNYSETIKFYQDGLGLRVSDHIRAPMETPEGTIDFDATFFHTVTGRHHSFATAQLPFPKRVHHVMVEVEDFNDVGLAYDRCVAAGLPIMMGLGHHPNDGMFSFYVMTPSGFAVEFGHGGAVIDDADWEVRTYSQLSDWGHAPPNEH